MKTSVFDPPVDRCKGKAWEISSQKAVNLTHRDLIDRSCHSSQQNMIGESLNVFPGSKKVPIVIMF